MGTSTEEIVMRMKLDAASVKASTAEMLASQKGAADKFVGFWKEAFAPLAAVFTVGGILEFTKSVSELGKQIVLTSERLGISTDEVQKLEYAGKMTGVELDTIAAALDRLAKAKEAVLNGDPGSSKMLDSFTRFGVTINDIRAMAPIELFNKISDSVSKTGANAEVTASAMELFGRGAGKLIPLLAQLREQSQDAPIISQEDLDNIKQCTEDLEGLKMKLIAIGATIEARLFNKKTWQEFGYAVTHPFTNSDDIAAKFGDPEKILDPKKKADYLKAHPEAAPKAPVAASGSDAGGDAPEGGGAEGSKKSGDIGELYRRRAELMRKIRNVGGNSYSDFQLMSTELRGITDRLAVENAPNETAKLGVERGQAARDLGVEQRKLVPPDQRPAQSNRIHQLADVVSGYDAQIKDRGGDGNGEVMMKHMENQTTALNKIAQAVHGDGIHISGTN